MPAPWSVSHFWHICRDTVDRAIHYMAPTPFWSPTRSVNALVQHVVDNHRSLVGHAIATTDASLWFASGSPISIVADTAVMAKDYAALRPGHIAQGLVEMASGQLQSNTVGGMRRAIMLDMQGGFVSAWTGHPASLAQQWAAYGWTTALSAFPPTQPAGWAMTLTSTTAKTSSALGAGRAPEILSASSAMGVLGDTVPGWQGGALRAASHAGSLAKNIGDTITTLNVGGVLFDHCDADLSECGEICGAYWDEPTQSVVLISRPEPGAAATPLRMETLNADHLKAALRAAIAGLPLGVSIDPPGRLREQQAQGALLKDGEPMLVSYLGQTQATVYGAIMFEADRLLKCLSNGLDNHTHRSVLVDVPGYQSLMERALALESGRTESWQRFWFVIDTVRLRHDPRTTSLAFDEVKVRVLTETEAWGEEASDNTDPAAEQFARHLTDRYDEYAHQFPVLRQLKELAKVAAVAKYLVNAGVPLDLGWLFDSPPVEVITASSTPAITAECSREEVRGAGQTLIRTMRLFGGVDLDADATMLEDPNAATSMRNAAATNRPSLNARTWDYHQNGLRLKAQAVCLRRQNRRVVCDTGGSVGDVAADLQPHRSYGRGGIASLNFGRGWLLDEPQSLLVLANKGKHPEVHRNKERGQRPEPRTLVFHDRCSGFLAAYRETKRNGKPVFVRIVSQKLSSKSVSFEYDGSDCIELDGDQYLRRTGSRASRFDLQGRLKSISQDGHVLSSYQRSNGTLDSILDGDGRGYRFQYEPGTPARVRRLVSTDGESIDYSYDEEGLLQEWRTSLGRGGAYAYDAFGRLTEERDLQGHVTCRYVYGTPQDSFGGTSDEGRITDDSGMIGSLSGGRLDGLQDDRCNYATYQYGSKGELSAVYVHGQNGRCWVLGFDSNGNLSTFRAANGITMRLSFTPGGWLERLDAHGRSLTFRWDEEGRPNEVCVTTSEPCDASMMGIRKLSPTGTRFSWKHGRLSGVHQPEETMSFFPAHGRSLFVRRSTRWSHRQTVLDRWLRPLRDRWGGGGSFRWKYADDNRSWCVHTKAGVVHHRILLEAQSEEIIFDY